MADVTYSDGVPATGGGGSATGVVATDLVTIRTQVHARLIEVLANPKPSYQVDGEDQEVRWTEYQAMLFAQLKQLDEAIARGEVDGIPFEIVSRGVT
jgi:hypothetical protein